MRSFSLPISGWVGWWVVEQRCPSSVLGVRKGVAAGYSSASMYLVSSVLLLQPSRSCLCGHCYHPAPSVPCARAEESTEEHQEQGPAAPESQTPSPLGTFSLGLVVPTVFPAVTSSDCCDHTVADYGTSLPCSIRHSVHGASHHTPLSPLLCS